jgi:hypothetical protein
MADSSRPTDPGHPVLAATPARQGRLGRHMVWVLVIGTFLAALALFLAWTGAWPSLSAADSKLANAHAKQAPSFHAPEPAPVVQEGADHTAPQQP